MESITTEIVKQAAKELLENNRAHAVVFAKEKLPDRSGTFFIDTPYNSSFMEMGLDSIDGIFRFESGENLTKSNLGGYRARIKFEAGNPAKTIFLKRYNRPPVPLQLKNWFSHCSRISCAYCELGATLDLAAGKINVPKVVAFGQQWHTIFEDKSFIASEKIPNAEALERKLPEFVVSCNTRNQFELRKDFINRLADFVRKFHDTGYRHRDLYLSHIFYDSSGNFHLIDLGRAFRPSIMHERFRIKDIAQLHYSAPAQYFFNTDRLRFYLNYTQQKRLTKRDKNFIRSVSQKANRMARHDVKHGRIIPYMRTSGRHY